MNKNEIGRRRIKEVLGDKIEEALKAFEEISPDFTKYIIEFAYGDLYTRTGLADKSREIAAVSCLIGQHNTGLPLKSHLNGMLNIGWTKAEIIEVIIYLTAYAGFPSCVDAMQILKQVLVERGEL